MHRTPRIVVPDPLNLRGQGTLKQFRLRRLQRSLTKALIVAGLLVTWVAPSAKASAIYWANASTNPGTIGSANLDGTDVNQSLITGVTYPSGLAVDGTYIYWANGSGVGRANLDGTGVNLSFISGGANTYGVAVNGSYIYWANLSSGTIGRADLDGTRVNQSFIGVYNTSAITVDGTSIYWTNTFNGTIGRANLDGTSVNNLFISGAGGPTGVAVDGTSIYWGNYYAGTIGRANLDGTDVNPSFITGAVNPSNIADDGTYIYWTNYWFGHDRPRGPRRHGRERELHHRPHRPDRYRGLARARAGYGSARDGGSAESRGDPSQSGRQRVALLVVGLAVRRRPRMTLRLRGGHFPSRGKTLGVCRGGLAMTKLPSDPTKHLL